MTGSGTPEPASSGQRGVMTATPSGDFSETQSPLPGRLTSRIGGAWVPGYWPDSNRFLSSSLYFSRNCTQRCRPPSQENACARTAWGAAMVERRNQVDIIREGWSDVVGCVKGLVREGGKRWTTAAPDLHDDENQSQDNDCARRTSNQVCATEELLAHAHLVPPGVVHVYEAGRSDCAGKWIARGIRVGRREVGIEDGQLVDGDRAFIRAPGIPKHQVAGIAGGRIVEIDGVGTERLCAPWTSRLRGRRSHRFS